MSTYPTDHPYIALWPALEIDDAAPGRSVWNPPAESFLPSRVVRNVVDPTMTVHLPAPGTATGAAVVVCPGGAFHIHSIDTEGYEVAAYLAARGIVAFTVEYRLAPTPLDDADMVAFMAELFVGGADLPALVAEHEPKALADGIRAVELVRSRAAEWDLDPAKVGILGFSAGGYVAAGAALHGTGDGRPAFCGAIYPARWTEPVAPADAGPLFIAMSADDQIGHPVIYTGFALQRAWAAVGRPVELHVYQAGGHGYGTRHQGTTSDAWLDQFHSWLTYNIAAGTIGG